MVARIEEPVPVGRQRSTRVRSAAPAAANGSVRTRRTRVRSVKRLDADGTSDMTTSTPAGMQAQSIPAATGRPKRTKPSASRTAEDSRSGGVDLTVTSAAKRDLAKIAERDPDLACSSLAMSLLKIARAIDDPDSTTSLSMCSKSLNETLATLRELCPPERKSDALDDLANRRAQRRAGLSTAAV